MKKEQQGNTMLEGTPLSEFHSPFLLADALLRLLSRRSLLYALRPRLPSLPADELKDIILSNPDHSLKVMGPSL